MEKYKILIIEDNSDTRRFLETILKKNYETMTAENGVIGIDYARNKAPDLIILDVMLPILNGYDACSLLKKDEKTKRIPIILLSAKSGSADVNQGLTVGADDYITKPFDYKELIARVQARLKKGSIEEKSPPLIVGDLHIEESSREVSFDGKKIQLTLTEFDILRFLATRAGSVVSREEILKKVWNDDSEKTNDRTIDVHIRALRKKVPTLSKHIISIYGVGYKYEA